jgi:hypothetical protein
MYRVREVPIAVEVVEVAVAVGVAFAPGGRQTFRGLSTSPRRVAARARMW